MMVKRFNERGKGAPVLIENNKSASDTDSYFLCVAVISLTLIPSLLLDPGQSSVSSMSSLGSFLPVRWKWIMQWLPTQHWCCVGVCHSALFQTKFEKKKFLLETCLTLLSFISLCQCHMVMETHSLLRIFPFSKTVNLFKAELRFS